MLARRGGSLLSVWLRLAVNVSFNLFLAILNFTLLFVIMSAPILVKELKRKCVVPLFCRTSYALLKLRPREGLSVGRILLTKSQSGQSLSLFLYRLIGSQVLLCR